MSNNKGFISVVVVVLISVMAVGLVGVAWYYEANKDEVSTTTNTTTAVNTNSNTNVKESVSYTHGECEETCQEKGYSGSECQWKQEAEDSQVFLGECESSTKHCQGADCYCYCTPVSDDTSDWQTYTNDEYNYSFQYPDGWTITRENEDVGNELKFNTTLQTNDYTEVVTDNGFTVGLTSGAKINIWTQPESSIKTTDELAEFYNLGSGSHFKLTEDYITIDNRQALHHTLDDYTTGVIEDTHFIYNDSWYSITVYTDEANSSYVGLFDQIISTFQFLPDTSDWQTYTNDEFNFTLQYPLNWVVVDTRDEWGHIVGFHDSLIESNNLSWAQIHIKYSENPESLNVCEFYKKRSEESEIGQPDYCADFEVNELVVSGISALQFPIVPGVIGNTITSFLHDGKVFSITLGLDNNREPQIYNKIVESFQFTE